MNSLVASEMVLARRSLRAASICGATPLVCGTSVLGLFCLTLREGWAVVGMATIAGGFIVFCNGTLSLLRFLRLTRGAQKGAAGRRRGMAVGAALLLLSNFPAAGLCVVGAVASVTRYSVAILNETELPLQNQCPRRV